MYETTATVRRWLVLPLIKTTRTVTIATDMICSIESLSSKESRVFISYSSIYYDVAASSNDLLDMICKVVKE